jgi:hypothetical protein
MSDRVVLLARNGLAGQVTLPIMQAVYEANNLTLISARLPQIFKAFSERSTGGWAVPRPARGLQRAQHRRVVCRPGRTVPPPPPLIM